MNETTPTGPPAHWRYLLGIAYRMLGSVHDAEDAVQEAYARKARAADPDVRAERAYLTTLVTRICIDKLRSAAHQRESYVGVWLPEPIPDDRVPDPAEAGVTADSLSLAFLTVLETLDPVERAVFLLREVFGYPHAEVAEIVGRTDANVRQIAHRSREAIEARRPRYEVPAEHRRRIAQRFVDALRAADVGGVLELLADDVVLRSDGGGQVRAARKPVNGAETVGRFLWSISHRATQPLRLESLELNGLPGLLAYAGDELIGAIGVEVHGDRVGEIFVVANPDKLVALREGST